MAAPKEGHRAALLLILLLCGGARCAEALAQDVFRAQGVRYRAEVVATGLGQPSAMVFLPDGRALLIERSTAQVDLLDVKLGAISHLEGGFAPSNPTRPGVRDEATTPALTGEDAGLHDIALHPGYGANGWIYISYSYGEPERSTTAVDRCRLRGTRLVDRQRIFTAQAYSEDRFHYGGRLAFVGEYLFVTLGDRRHQDRAQRLSSHAGKIVRLHDDGRVPSDNPFFGRTDARPEIWSYGHRNPQGLMVHPKTGELWSHEHGPLGGDKLNVIRRGANYGWPVISWGWEYSGGPIGMGITAKEGMEQPVWVWTPDIAPSGMVVYTGDAFSAWRGSMFIGSLVQHHLNRLVIEDGHVVLEERLMYGKAGRVRLVAQGPDGFIYIGNDGGQLLRLRPEN
jgi:glucose/arabinose dehydrogenase